MTRSTKLGVKTKEYTWEEVVLILDGALTYGASQTQCVSLLRDKGIELDKKELEYRLFRQFGLSFEDYRERKLDNMKLKLVETAIARALRGSDKLLMFCLKNLAGWVDRLPPEVTNNLAIMNIEDLVKRLNNTTEGENHGTRSVIDIEASKESDANSERRDRTERE